MMHDSEFFEGELQDVVSSREGLYTYPGGLDLRPGHPFHNELLEKLLSRARASKEVMQRRYSSWRKVDNTLNIFIPKDKEEEEVKRADSRKPVSIVVPASFATLKTLMAYSNASFLADSPAFRYSGIGPEDQGGAMLLERIVELQVQHSRARLNLMTMFRDGFTYGFGAVTPIWEILHSKRTEVVEETFFNSLLSVLSPTGGKKRQKKNVTYEGNRIDNINPYTYLPDPNVPIQDVQKGEFVGWITRSNRFAILEREENNKDNFFNAKFVRYAGNGTSSLMRDSSGGDQNADLSRADGSYSPGQTRTNRQHLNPVDEMPIFINLIPKEWKLSSKETPEKWFFMVAADRVIIAAKPLPHDHNLFPVVINAPDFDGYGVTPTSRMEVIYGLQGIADWFINSRMANVRKSNNDMLIFDPQKLNTYDMERPGPGKLVRARMTAWGGSIKDAIYQVPVQDITKNHMSDLTQIESLMRSVSGASDAAQGVLAGKKERISAEETRQVGSGTLSRLESSSLVTSIMAMDALAFMLGSQTQQYMSQEQYVQMAGRGEKELRDTFDNDEDQQFVGPLDISIDFDVIAHDGKVVDAEHIGTWMRLFEIIQGDATGQLAKQFDTKRIFNHIAGLTGVKNLRDFEIKIQPDEQVAQQVQAGNLAPIGGLPNG